MMEVLPRVLRSPEPHHPEPLDDGARGGPGVVAMLDPSASGACDMDTMTDAQLADELIRRRGEIDRLEAEFAQLAWFGHRRGGGGAGGWPAPPAGGGGAPRGGGGGGRAGGRGGG